jgi:outer membrane murein-binding lipoprotein Lpp
MNSGGSVYINSSNKNMTLQTDTTALVYLKGDVNKVGILTMNPQQALQVAGTIRVDSLSNNLIPTKLVGGSNSNDLTNVELGTGLSFVNDTLKIADNIINSGDTATLLRKDYLGINSNVLVWTEGNKKLLPYFTQVYRNGQLLKYENQYTITSDSILTLAVGSFRLKDNITIIAIDNIVALAGSGGLISLTGHVSGSGTNTINTTINNGVVTNTMLAGGISNDKLDVISTVGKVNNSATTATSLNTNNAIVSRNASGDFSAGNITANNITANNFYGLASIATIANTIQSSTTTGVIRLATPSNAVTPTITVPNANSTMAITNASQTFTGTQTFSSTISGNIDGNASTVTSITPSNFASQTANTVLIAPNGSAGVPTFRTLVAADIPTLNQNTTGTASNVTGTIAVANGGTALTSIPAKSIIVANTANTYAAISPTAGQSIRINAGNTSWETYTPTTGTVTSIATGYGLSGGTITTTGTLRLDSATVFNRIRDSIVDVAIGNDTIKILKQEYAPALSSVLTWTITPKFPIQLKAYILVFRNGQLLNNDQYNLTDTNKITIVSTSFKTGANYTVATVSGIGSIGTGVFPNPVYPEAGIALSTGSAWASSITNNSANWNIAYNDKINNAAFTGTNTKTLTLTQLDGGTLTPTFTDLQGVTGVTGGTGLTGGTITTTGTLAVDFTVVAPLASPTFTGTVSGITKSMVGLGNVDNTSDANKPISSATQTALDLKQNALGNASASVSGILTSTDWTTFNNKQSALGFTPANSTITIGTNAPLQGGGDLTANRTLSITQATTSANGFLTSTDWNTFNNKGNGTVTSVTVSATSGNPLSISNTTTTPVIELLSATSARNGYLTSTDWTTFNGKQNTLTSGVTIKTINNVNLLSSGNLDVQTVLSAATSSVSGFLLANDWVTFNGKQNALDGTGFVKASGTSISYDNSTYLTTSLAASTYLPLTGGTLTGNLRLSSSNATQLNIDANDNNLESRITFSTTGSARSKIYTTSSVSSMTFESIAQASARRGFRFISSTEGTQYLGLVQDPQGNVGIKSDAIGNDVHPNTLYVNGTLGITGAATLTNLGGNGNRMVVTNNSGLLSTQAIPTSVEPNLYIQLNGPTIVLSASMGSQSTYFLHIDNVSTVTVTLPTASLNTNKSITIKNAGSGAVNSNDTNVQRLTGTLVNSILLSGGGKFATLVSDGFNWITMAAN